MWDIKTYGEEYNIFRNKAGHEDNFPIAKFIYMLIWGDYDDNEPTYRLPELYYACDVNCLYNMQNYSSDTMNPIRDSKYYQTIGNFMLLPKNNYEKYYFNTYRHQKYRDNFIVFLQQMETLFENKNKDIIFNNLKTANGVYFEKIGNFKNFIKINYLEDFIQYLNKDSNYLYQNMEELEGIILKRSNLLCNSLKQKLFNK